MSPERFDQHEEDVKTKSMNRREEMDMMLEVMGKEMSESVYNNIESMNQQLRELADSLKDRIMYHQRSLEILNRALDTTNSALRSEWNELQPKSDEDDRKMSSSYDH